MAVRRRPGVPKMKPPDTLLTVASRFCGIPEKHIAKYAPPNLGPPQERLVKVAPSDLVFLWEDCPYCFYCKVALGQRLPKLPMPPPIFTVVDACMKRWAKGQRTESILPAMPPGRFDFVERSVESEVLELQGRACRCVLRGRSDLVATLDDGSYAVIDLKTAAPEADVVSRYSRQLHSYALALERPAAGRQALKPVTKLGLLFFTPETFADPEGRGTLSGPLSWIEIPRDDRVFFEFLNEVLVVLEQPSPPWWTRMSIPRCFWCRTELFGVRQASWRRTRSGDR